MSIRYSCTALDSQKFTYTHNVAKALSPTNNVAMHLPSIWILASVTEILQRYIKNIPRTVVGFLGRSFPLAIVLAISAETLFRNAYCTLYSLSPPDRLNQRG